MSSEDLIYNMCIPHKIPRTWEQQVGESIRLWIDKNTKKITRSFEGRNIVTKRKVPNKA